MVALGSSYKYFLNSAKSDITIDQFLRSILLRFFIEKIKTLYSINFISDII